MMDPTSPWYPVLLVAVVALVTALLRFLPFLLFGRKEKMPAVITYLGKALPFAVMGMLVVYCMKGVTPLVYPYGIPEASAGLVVVLLHLWRRNTLVSILGGTVVYMLLVQLVFAV